MAFESFLWETIGSDTFPVIHAAQLFPPSAFSSAMFLCPSCCSGGQPSLQFHFFVWLCQSLQHSCRQITCFSSNGPIMSVFACVLALLCNSLQRRKYCMSYLSWWCLHARTVFKHQCFTLVAEFLGLVIPFFSLLFRQRRAFSSSVVPTIQLKGRTPLAEHSPKQVAHRPRCCCHTLVAAGIKQEQQQMRSPSFQTLWLLLSSPQSSLTQPAAASLHSWFSSFSSAANQGTLGRTCVQSLNGAELSCVVNPLGIAPSELRP